MTHICSFTVKTIMLDSSINLHKLIDYMLNRYTFSELIQIRLSVIFHWTGYICY